MALNKSDKMDRAAVRTAADIEQKYNFGKSFAKAMGLAEDARTTADEALEAAQTASNIDHEKIFNLLTNNGEVQCIREIDGQIYINASYINSGILSADRLNLEELFAKNINMSGTFTHTVEAFIPPGKEEYEMLQQALLVSSPAPYNPLLDFKSDGLLDFNDLNYCRSAMLGQMDLSTWSGAVKTPVTLTIDLKNPEKAIKFTGTNMWGRAIEKYIGVSFTNIETQKTAAIADYVVERGEVTYAGYDVSWQYELWNSGIIRMNGFADWRLLDFTQDGSVNRSGEILLYLPYSMTTPHTVIHNALGIEQAVWGGQARLPRSEYGDFQTVIVEAFCGTAAKVTTCFNIEVTGKWK